MVRKQHARETNLHVSSRFLSVCALVASLMAVFSGELILSARAQTIASYDWKGALASALKIDNDVLVHRQKLKHAQKARHSLNSYEAVPRMSLSGEGGGAFGKVDKQQQKSAGEITPYAGVGIELEQKIADGGERKAGLREKRIAVSIARAALQNAEQKLITRALKRYINLRYYALLYKAREREHLILQQGLRLTDDIDTLPVWERWNASQTAQRGETTLLTSREKLDESRGNFFSTFQFLPNVEEMTRVDLPLELIPRTFEESLQIARRANPAYLVETHKAQSVANEILKARSQGLPKLSMVAEGRYRYNPLNERFHDRSTQELFAYAGLRVDWQLADTFRLRGLVNTARAEAMVAEKTRGLFESDRREVMGNAWNSLVSLSAQYASQQDFGRANARLVSDMREAMNANENGEESEVDDSITAMKAIDLEARFIETQVLLLDTERELILAYVDLLSEMGLLDRSTLSI